MRDHLRLALAGSLCAFSASASAGLGDTLQTLRDNLQDTTQRLQDNLQDTTQRLADNLQSTGQRLGDGLQETGQRLNDNLTASFEQLRSELEIGFARLQHRYLFPTDGTIAFEDAIEHEGVGRRIIYIRPETTTETPAPAIVLLHYNTGTAEDIANAVDIGALVAATGAWAIVPEGLNQHWNDDPGSVSGADDVGFLAKLIDTATAQYPIDATRVYVAGMSNGGFMATRLACERPELVAAVASVAASMRTSQAAACAPAIGVPMVQILGTNDPYVAYNARLGLLSARETFDHWRGINHCDLSAVDETALPDTVNDGTTTVVSRGVDCGADTALYTVNGGGHTWPQWTPTISPYSLGRVAKDFSGNEAIWSFFSSHSRP